MNTSKAKNIQRARRQKRIRAKVAGTADRPRLSVFKSNKFLYVQLIDDDKGNTLASGSTKEIKGKTPVIAAKELGAEIAKKAGAKKITKVVFDRGGYIYTGKIKAVAEGAREGGLKF
jgi:large subunit ribosomal protein L18